MLNFRQLLVPGHHNDFKPHLLRSKRTAFYSLVFITLKAIIITAALLVPHEAYLLPDILQAEANRVYTFTNSLRSDSGIATLRQSNRLARSADAKANDMVSNSYFSHTGPSGHTLSYFLRQANYPYLVAGENLAMGFVDAKAVMAGWKESPTHQANLVDKDFKELGVAVAMGSYKGEQTVFMVQHFGSPSQPYVDRISTAAVLPIKIAGSIKNKSVTAQVLGETSNMIYLVRPTDAKPTVTIDRTVSRVYWQAASDGGTTLLVKAKIFGALKSATVMVRGYTIELSREATSSPWFAGQLTVPNNSEYFFKPVILPTIIIVPKIGANVREAIDWYNIQVPEETPVEQYFKARDFLPSFTQVFAISRFVYFVAIFIFSFLLLITMFVRSHRPQYKIMAQTLFMLVLLTGLWWV
jgi:uncharacterized protein YkwD